MKVRIASTLLALALPALAGCTPNVPSTRYLGTPMFVVADLQPAALNGPWYEIARFPFAPQEGCRRTTATYAARADGLIAVDNRCEIGGTVRRSTGTAQLVGPGRLKVALEGVPFRGDYWVLGLSRDRRTLVVGTPSRVAGWVLHRDRQMTPFQIDDARDLFDRNGYDAAALQRTDQRR